MLDTNFRTPYQKIAVDPILKFKLITKIHPNIITLIGCVTGIISSFFIIYNYKITGSLILLLSGYFDTLDGSIARLQNKKSNLGTILDIYSDRVVEFFIILSLFFADPDHRAFTCLVMLGACLLCVTSFLTIGIFSENNTKKSFHYSSGIMERTETFIFFILMILFNHYFYMLATVFVSLVILTSLMRISEYKKQTQ